MYPVLVASLSTTAFMCLYEVYRNNAVKNVIGMLWSLY